ncbi:MAG: tRNA (N6-isopentenyl adenosine(37)-C2)-methylthiotransferase MiaB, partial [Omnitrophica WOR_2 bacterium GWC2_45_7]
GPDSYKRLPQLIKECYATDVGTEHCSVRTGKPYDVTLSEFETYADVYPSRQEGVNAWIAIMRGCNNFCTFCVVPYTRGRERSRPAANILDEVRRLVGEGFKQVTLLGQNVNSYHDGTNDFADLIEQVSQMEGIRRVRFTSPHPKDFPDKLLEVMRQNPKICKHIHLPLQAGNNRILDMMNRSYTRDEFLALVHKIREFCPGIALSTDVIVGFPTETNAEFTDTLSVMREVEFDSAFMFKYSERKGTTASKKYKDDVSEEDKARRIIELNDLQKDISLKKNRAHIGETFDVLVNHERPAKLPDQWQGRTDGNKLVIFKSDPVVPGDLIPVQITDATPHALKGESAI